MKDQILVIGASGFIGTALVNALVEDGRKVVAVGRHATTSTDDSRTGNTSEYYSALLGDSTAAVWLACTTTPGSSAGNPMIELDENLRPFFAFLGALQKHPDCKLLYVSTGGAAYGDVPGGLAQESHLLVPKSYYSAGKAAAEHFISACCRQYGCHATILRPSNVYGHGQAYRPGFGIIPTAFNALLNETPLTIWGEAQITRDYLNIDDFVSLCLRVLDQPAPELVSTFNASSGEGVSIDTLLSAIERVTGKTVMREYRAGRAIDVSRIVLDNREARERFGWQPTIALEQGLAHAWQWFGSTRR